MRHEVSLPRRARADHRGRSLNRTPNRSRLAATVRIDSSGAPTVGREPELDRLDAALETLATRLAACVAVEGEPGIGKTRLLGELAARAEQRGSPRAHRLGDRVRARAAVRRLGRRARCLRGLAGARPRGQMGRRARRSSSAEIVPSLRRPDRRPRKAGRRRALPRAPRGPRAARAARARPAARRSCSTTCTGATSASIELLGALLRREAGCARCCSRSRFRRGTGAGRASRPALAVPAVRRIALEQLSEARGDRAPRRSRSAGGAAIYRHGGGNPFYLEQLARAAGDGRSTTVLGNGDGGVAVRRRAGGRRGVARRGARIARAGRAHAARGGRRRGRAVRARSRGGDRRARRRRTGSARSTRSSRSISCARRRCRAGSSSAIRSCAAPSTSRRPAAGGSALTRGRRRCSPDARRRRRRARAPRRAVGRAGRRGRRSRSCSTAGVGGRRARPGRGRSLVRGGAAPAAGRRRSRARSTSACRSPRRLRSLGELERCRATLLEAIELLPPEAADRRVELTALCAAVEHWLGRHGEAHHRLVRAWDELPDRSTAAAAMLQIELAVDGLYELDFEQTVEMGRGALATAAKAGGDRALVAAAASALCLGETVAGRIDGGATRTATRPGPRSIGCRTPSSRRASRRSTTSAGPRRTSSATTTRSRTSSAASRSRGRRGEGRLLVPLHARQELPVRDAGPARARRSSCCETRARGRAAVGQPARALPRAVRARLDAVLRGRPRRRDRGLRGERARRSRGSPGARSPTGRRARLGARRRLVRGGADRARARRSCSSSCADGRRAHDARRALLRLGEPRAGRARGREPRGGGRLRAPRRGGRGAARAAAAARRSPVRTRAAVLLAAGEPLEAARPGRASPPRRRVAVGARLQAAFSRGLAGPRARRRRASAREAIAVAAHGRGGARRVRLGARARRDCAASCAGSARAPSRAAPSAPATAGSRR